MYGFTCSCPVFPASLTEEALFSLLYILASFVIDQLTVSVWVYFWALYSVSLIYMSLFVPVPHVLIPVAVQYYLKSGRVMPLALLFFLRIGNSEFFVISYKF